MAIVYEHFTVNGRDFVRTYSDAGRYVVGGSPEDLYIEATDPADLNRTYIEGDIIADDDISDKAAAFDVLVGVGE